MILATSTMQELDRIAARLSTDEAVDEGFGDHRLNPEFAATLEARALTPAAVLIPLIERKGRISVILTQRSAALRAHGGQVAFPGGRIDPGDHGAIGAALREAEEEIALPRAHVRPLGHLPQYLTGSGYRIAPVVAEVEGDPRLKANPEEVNAIFEVPLEALLDPAGHVRASRVFQGIERHFYEIPHDSRRIWGVTAGIIRMFYEKVAL